MLRNRFIQFLVFLLLITTFGSAVSQDLTIRRLPGGFLQIRDGKRTNLLLIQPEAKSQKPEDLNSDSIFLLGDDFQPVLIESDAKAGLKKTTQKSGAKIPPDSVLVEPVLVGKKKAGIRLRTHDVNVVIANVDLLSDQSFLTTQRDEKIDLLVLSVADATRLNTARINLWVSLIDTRQIALNPTRMMTDAQMNEFYQSLPKRRIFPTGILPMLEIPNRNLQFGDRQVIRLKELE